MFTALIVGGAIVAVTVYGAIGIYIGAKATGMSKRRCMTRAHRECFHELHYLLSFFAWPIFGPLNLAYGFAHEDISLGFKKRSNLSRKERKIEAKRRAEIEEAEHRVKLAQLKAKEAAELDRQLGELR